MSDVLLVVVVAVALGFDFTNGFHDTANAVATSISTRAMTPRVAVLVAAALDDVCDNVDEAAAKLVSLGVESIRETARQQAEVILQATTKLDEAIQRLEGFRDSSQQLDALRQLEDEGDELVRDAVAELFTSTDDAKVIIRWKDIHERLEEAVDALENAADVLEAILVKNR